MLPQISSLALEVVIASTGFLSSLIASGVIFRSYVFFRKHLAKLSEILRTAAISLSVLAVNASVVSIVSMTSKDKDDFEFFQVLQNLKELSQNETFTLSATLAAFLAISITIYFSFASYREQVRSIDQMESKVDDLMHLIQRYGATRLTEIEDFERSGITEDDAIDGKNNK